MSRNRNRKVTPELEAFMHKMADMGFSDKIIAEKCKISQGTVGRYLIGREDRVTNSYKWQNELIEKILNNGTNQN